MCSSDLNLLPATPYVKANRIRALAVTSAKRAHSAPDIPTVAESGYPTYETTSWHGIVVPIKTSSAVVTRLNRELVKIARQPELRDLLGAQGSEVIGSTPQEFAAFIRSELQQTAKLIKASGAQAN